MTQITLHPNLLVKLLQYATEPTSFEIAERTHWSHIPWADCGNFDDAREIGEDDGCTLLAREILESAGLPYTVIVDE